MKKESGFYETTLRLSEERILQRQFELDANRIEEEFKDEVAEVFSKRDLEVDYRKHITSEWAESSNKTIDNFDKDPFESGLT